MNFFNLKLHNTTIRKEVISGISTYIAMSYILALTPKVLGFQGLNPQGVFVATIAASVFTTLIGAFYAKLPLAFAPGITMNILLVPLLTTICGGDMPLFFLGTYFAGVVIVIIMIIGLYDSIKEAIPEFLEYSVVIAVGIMLIFYGLDTLHIVKKVGTHFEFGKIITKQTIFCALAFLVFLLYRKIKTKGAMMIGMLITYVLVIISELISYVRNNPFELASFLKNYVSNGVNVTSITTVGFSFPEFSVFLNDYHKLFDLLSLVFVLSITRFFDSYGIISATVQNIKKDDVNFDKGTVKKSMLVNGIGSIISGCAGTCSVTTCAESITGIEGGAKTGLSSIVVCILLVLSLGFSPAFIAMSDYIIAPVMIFNGILLVGNVKKLLEYSVNELFASIFIIGYFLVTLDIGYAVIIGLLCYIFLQFVTGNKKKLTGKWPIIVVLSIISVIIRLYYVKGGIL